MVASPACRGERFTKDHISYGFESKMTYEQVLSTWQFGKHLREAKTSKLRTIWCLLLPSRQLKSAASCPCGRQRLPTSTESGQELLIWEGDVGCCFGSTAGLWSSPIFCTKNQLRTPRSSLTDHHLITSQVRRFSTNKQANMSLPHQSENLATQVRSNGLRMQILKHPTNQPNKQQKEKAKNRTTDFQHSCA